MEEARGLRGKRRRTGWREDLPLRGFFMPFLIVLSSECHGALWPAGTRE